MHKIGVIGDTGMVGSELLKILSSHDRVKVVYKKNSSREEGSMGDCDLVFLATKDEQSMTEAPPALDIGAKVIDMSGAYRLPREQFEEWYNIKHASPELIGEAVYGMPALYLDQIRDANLVANPGCYSTAVILALHPLLKSRMIKPHASITATSGISGARKEIEEAPNERAYSFGRMHKHVPEMELYSGEGFHVVNFVPIVLESVFKGINASIQAELSDLMQGGLGEDKLVEALRGFYGHEDLVVAYPFGQAPNIGTKDVNNTHKLLIRVAVGEGGLVVINSLIDNLGKGAASQAVENMNIMLGMPRLYGIDHVYRTG